MRCTVITPSGERFEGVTGSLLDYYLSEAETVPGFEITVDEGDVAASFPQVWQDGQRVDQPQQVEQLPEGQAFQTDGTEHVSDGTSPLPDAAGQVVDTETGQPVDAPPA